MTIDAGIWLPASVGDTVWHDLNGNGLQDSGENGIEGISVTLWSVGPDGVVGGGDDVPVVTDAFGNTYGSAGALTTDSNGNYLFDNLIPGIYYVSFGTTTSGGDAYGFTFQNTGDDTLDSDVNRTTGQSDPVTLVPGENNTTVDAGMMIANIALGNYVWWDIDGDGQQEPNGNDGIPGTGDDEMGVDGVTVELWYDDDADSGTPLVSIGTVLTSGGGYYSFNDILNPDMQPGQYQISFTLPSGHLFEGWTLSNTDVGSGSTDTDLDSDVTVDSGNPDVAWTDVFTLSENTSGEPNVDLRYDAGLVRYFTLGDYIWHDLDNDGVQDASDIIGVSGVVVELITPGADGVFGTGDDIVALDRDGIAQTMTTLSDGLYLFDNLMAGIYQVRMDLPE
ncbi:MAG: hypothetical protein H6546_07090 [Chitinophagales bacterium]|nr:hypothetical protein [Chitinophagales bacterium]